MPNFGTLDATGIRNLVSFRNQASGVLEILDEIREVWSVMADKRYAVGSKASVAEIRWLSQRPRSSSLRSSQSTHGTGTSGGTGFIRMPK